MLMPHQDGQNEISLSEYHVLTGHIIFSQAPPHLFWYQHVNLCDIFHLLIGAIVALQKSALFPGICIILPKSGIRFPVALSPPPLPSITIVIFAIEYRSP